MGICEEKGSGIDRVVLEAEAARLPAPRFRVDHGRTVATMFGPRPFARMDRADRIRACYQHCVVRWVTSQRMTNQTLRDRFDLPRSRASLVSHVITASMQEGVIKQDDRVGASKRYAGYVPSWA
jgi:predicted HTH transcriptional regulator